MAASEELVRGLAAYGDLLPGTIALGNERRGGIGYIEERSFDCACRRRRRAGDDGMVGNRRISLRMTPRRRRRMGWIAPSIVIQPTIRKGRDGWGSRNGKTGRRMGGITPSIGAGHGMPCPYGRSARGAGDGFDAG